MSDDDETPRRRGRARSRTLSGDVLSAELDLIASGGDLGSTPVVPEYASTPRGRAGTGTVGGGGGSPSRSPRGVTDKTKRILSLQSGGGAPGMEVELDPPKREETEAERAERLLEEGKGGDDDEDEEFVGVTRLATKEFDLRIKLLMLGESGVGKTSLLTRYADNKFDTSVLSTAGVDFKSHVLGVKGKRVKCEVWDTAGQQQFRAITTSYYSGAEGIVLVFDLSEPSRSSFKSIEGWMKIIDANANPSTLKVLVGNKADLPRMVSTSEGKDLAKRYKMPYFETSAKTGKNVNKAMYTLAKSIAKLKESAPAPTTPGEAGKKKKDCIIM